MLRQMIVPLIQLMWWVMIRSLQMPTYSFFTEKFGKLQYLSDACEPVGLPLQIP